jgi:hypothetical protein
MPYRLTESRKLAGRRFLPLHVPPRNKTAKGRPIGYCSVHQPGITKWPFSANLVIALQQLLRTFTQSGPRH